MATVSIGGVDFDSFEDVAGADAFLVADILRAGPWSTREADQKARGLISASRRIATLPWVGDPPDFNSPPTIVKEVTAMFAADLIGNPTLLGTAANQDNVRSLNVKSVAVEFFAPGGSNDGLPIPRIFWDMLTLAGLVSLKGDSSDIDPPVFISGACNYERPLAGRYEEDWPKTAEDFS